MGVLTAVSASNPNPEPAGEGKSEQGRMAVLALLQALGQGLRALSMYRCQVCSKGQGGCPGKQMGL